MIESENLRTASLYINNQLLSRGLLRDGQSLDFAHPGDTDGEVAETMSRIMATVNDLILRRDVSNPPLFLSSAWFRNWPTISSPRLTAPARCRKP
jgi:hypothetical protein